MSNYPPGVTGNEYEIAGPDREWEEEFQCTNDNFEFIMISPYSFEYASNLARKYSRVDTLEDVKENLYRYLSHLNACINLSDITKEVQNVKCGYVGDVVKESYRGQIWWQCPQCGKEYEDEVEWPEPYDEYYDY